MRTSCCARHAARRTLSGAQGGGLDSKLALADCDVVGQSGAEPAPEVACAARTPAPAHGKENKENKEGQAGKAEPGANAGEGSGGAGRSASGALKTPAPGKRAGAPLAGVATPGPTLSPFTPCALRAALVGEPCGGRSARRASQPMLAQNPVKTPTSVPRLLMGWATRAAAGARGERRSRCRLKPPHKALSWCHRS